MLLIRQRMVSWRIFTRSGPGHHWVPVLSHALKLLQMVRNIIIQRNSTGFRSRWVWGPVSGLISFILQELLELPPYYRHIRPAIVMYQVEPRTHCTTVWSDTGSNDFIWIPNGSQGVSTAEVCVSLHGYLSQGDEWPTTKPASLGECYKCST